MSEIENQLSILESHSTSASVDLLSIVRDLGLKLLHADLGSDVAGIIKKGNYPLTTSNIIVS